MSGIRVVKFGGTCMGTAESIRECTDVVESKLKQGQKIFVVVSAVSGITNGLVMALQLAKQRKSRQLDKLLTAMKTKHFDILSSLGFDNRNGECRKIIEDVFCDLKVVLNGITDAGNYSDSLQANVLSRGECLSSYVLKGYLESRNIKTKRVVSKDVIKTNGSPLVAEVDFTASKRLFRKKITPLMEEGITPVMTGFFGAGKNGEIMLLGRGGSDFSASIAGVLLNAEMVEIWTDVDGIMSTNPKITNNAVSWTKLNVDLATEMAEAGAQVLHPKAVYAATKGIDMLIKNLFSRNFVGTLINRNIQNNGICGIVNDGGYSILHLKNKNIFASTCFATNVLDVLKKNSIMVDVIATSGTSISLSIKSSEHFKTILHKLEKIAFVKVLPNMAKLSIVGHRITQNSNVVQKAFEMLNRLNIPIIMSSISCANNNITMLMPEKYIMSAVRQLHQRFIN